MSSIKAIQTKYNGFLFRSRLEARWAVFFDRVGLTYQYEPEGFDLDGVRYLPDFWLPKLNLWLEIKPIAPSKEDEEKVCRLSAAFDRQITEWSLTVELPLATEPPGISVLVGEPYWDPARGLAYDVYRCGWHETRLKKFPRRGWSHCALCGRVSLDSVGSCFTLEPDGSSEESLNCLNCDLFDRDSRGQRVPGAYFHEGLVMAPAGSMGQSEKLLAAYAAARSARFEHGERPG